MLRLILEDLSPFLNDLKMKSATLEETQAVLWWMTGLRPSDPLPTRDISLLGDPTMKFQGAQGTLQEDSQPLDPGAPLAFCFLLPPRCPGDHKGYLRANQSKLAHHPP